ncbi:MAG: tetraacyldisaccharide 4'-kinase [Deltaproteobacteria bacterium]|nr:tetraacyldisaccharide 4'-kinase [Deltaproteobacteria bacterium]MBW2075242.1 tetraacyldisaccharide 4'-kinase [Deltaproteobacteria bacterium]
MYRHQIRNPQSLLASRLRSRRWQAGAIRNAIEGVMTKGDMADPPFSSSLQWVLYACSKIYRIGVKLRINLYEKGVFRSKRLPCKVISIGNITVGGTGKTPMVYHVAKLLNGLDLEVAVISRGYGGDAQRSGGIVSNGKRIIMGPRASGDEPQLLASKLPGIPILVGRDRYQAGRRAISTFGSSVLVLDDAFQHLSLKRDLDLLLLDSMRPFGNGHCIPRGTLREPMEQLKRADAFILTRYQEGGPLSQTVSVIESLAQGRPIFKCRHVPERLFMAGHKELLDLLSLKGRRLLAFSGIARNDDFRATISGLDGWIAGSLEFPDHHSYSDDDLRSIWEKARDLNVDNIITTEKDYFNICSEIPLTPRLLVLAIGISFGDDAERFDSYIKKWALSP